MLNSPSRLTQISREYLLGAGLPRCSFPELQSCLFIALSSLLTLNFLSQFSTFENTRLEVHVLSTLSAESHSEHYFHTGRNRLPFNFKSTFWPLRPVQICLPQRTRHIITSSQPSSQLRARGCWMTCSCSLSPKNPVCLSCFHFFFYLFIYQSSVVQNVACERAKPGAPIRKG